jgi:hypothetical protein
MKTKPIAAGFKGLNSKLSRELYGPDDSGMVWLTKCSNVDIDDGNNVSVRPGYELVVPAALNPGTPILTGYCTPALPGAILFVEADALSLYFISDDRTERLMNVTQGRRMYYEYHHGRIYFGNGIEKGYVSIDTLLAHEWIAEETYSGERAAGSISDPPAMTHLHYYRGRMYGIVDDAIFYSLPHDMGRYVPDEGNLVVRRPSFIGSTENNLVIGDAMGVTLYAGTDPEEGFNVKRIHDAPAIAGTGQHVFPTRIGLEGFQLGLIMMTGSGLLFVNDDMTVMQLSQNHFDIPELSDLNGTSCIHNGKYYCQFNVIPEET